MPLDRSRRKAAGQKSLGRRGMATRSRPPRTTRRAAGWRTRAEQARRDLAQIEALPVTEAAQLVRERAARAEAERKAAERAQAARDARTAKLHQFRSPSPDHGVTRPERDAPGM